MDNQTNQGQGLEIPAEVRNFLETLLQDANMTFADDEMKEEMIKELYARLDNFITSTIVNNMPPEHLDEFIKLNEEKKPQAEIEEFLKNNLPNSQEIMTKAFMEFRDLYLGNVAVARNTPQEENQTEPEQQDNTTN